MKPSHPFSTDALIPLPWLICREVKEKHAKLTRGTEFHTIPRAKRPPWFREYIRLAACFRTFNSQWVYFFGCVCTGMLKERCGEGRHGQLWIIYDISESWKHFFSPLPKRKAFGTCFSAKTFFESDWTRCPNTAGHRNPVTRGDSSLFVLRPYCCTAWVGGWGGDNVREPVSPPPPPYRCGYL